MWEELEKQAIQAGFSYPVGVDEAGRGPLAGPVVAAAVYLPLHIELEVRDSKELSPKKRRILYEAILRREEIDVGIGVISASEIDRVNILQATFKAMQEAVAKLKNKPDYLLIDGNQPPPIVIAKKCVIEGDRKVRSIAAASIVAKEYRDDLMKELHECYPQYNFLQHKGYPTKEHQMLLKQYGPSPIHRRSFAPVREVVGNGS